MEQQMPDSVVVNDTGSAAFTDRPMSKIHHFYLVDDVGPPSQYVNWFDTIRNAGENDVVVIHINSFGGQMFTAIQFMRVMHETKAQVVASVEGLCMSAATCIFLAAKHWEISKHTMFMFHNYSSGTFGKGGEIYDSAIHGKKWSETLWRDIYAGFLTEEEIGAILQNKDIYMSGDEVSKRLIARNKTGEIQTKKGIVVPGKMKAPKPPKKTKAKPTKKS